MASPWLSVSWGDENGKDTIGDGVHGGLKHFAHRFLKVYCGQRGEPSTMEDVMAARTTREEARDRVLKAFMDSLDRIIPPDESVPLRGRTFLDWERQADELRKAVVPTVLQERAALDPGAVVTQADAGSC